MRFNVDYREEKAGALKGAKHYYLIGRVEFTEEEKAIIQQRGLYDRQIPVPSGDVPTTRAKHIGTGFMKVGGAALIGVGFITYCTAKVTLGQGGTEGAVTTGIIILLVGIGLYGWAWFRDSETKRINNNPDQLLTPRQLLTNPEFKVYAPDMQVAKGFEAMVRESLTEFTQFLRDSASVPEKTSYDL